MSCVLLCLCTSAIFRSSSDETLPIEHSDSLKNVGFGALSIQGNTQMTKCAIDIPDVSFSYSQVYSTPCSRLSMDQMLAYQMLAYRKPTHRSPQQCKVELLRWLV